MLTHQLTFCMLFGVVPLLSGKWGKGKGKGGAGSSSKSKDGDSSCQCTDYVESMTLLYDHSKADDANLTDCSIEVYEAPGVGGVHFEKATADIVDGQFKVDGIPDFQKTTVYLKCLDEFGDEVSRKWTFDTSCDGHLLGSRGSFGSSGKGKGKGKGSGSKKKSDKKKSDKKSGSSGGKGKGSGSASSSLSSFYPFTVIAWKGAGPNDEECPTPTAPTASPAPSGKTCDPPLRDCVDLCDDPIPSSWL